MTSRLRGPALAVLGAAIGLVAAGRPPLTAQDAKPGKFAVPPPPVQFKLPQLGLQTLEASEFVKAGKARTDFKVSGKGLAAAVLDTGLNAKHVDFAGRVPVQKNFTGEGGPDDANDTNGHGTNVAGIIAANKDHVGMAPDANIIPIKVLGAGGGTFEDINKGLQWVLANHKAQSITVVNMSLSDSSNHTDPDAFGNEAVRTTIKKLTDERVAVVIAAGNHFFPLGSKEGMGYPAIFPEAISVGAQYDANVGPFEYGNGAKANTTAAGRITPFSQRLHPDTEPKKAFTHIFAPGAPVTSAGIDGTNGESIQHGTSQAAPVTAGVILLLQEFHIKATGQRPTVDQLKKWIKEGAVKMKDGDDENDNVQHPNPPKEYLQLDALGAMKAAQRELQLKLLKGQALKGEVIKK